MAYINACQESRSFTNKSKRGIVYFLAAALVALFSQIIANPSRPDVKSDILRINGVVAFLARVASQEQNTCMDYVLARVLTSAARRAIHRARSPTAKRKGASQPLQSQGQRWAQNSNLRQSLSRRVSIFL